MVWDVNAQYRLGEEVAAHLYAINDLALSPDAKYLASASMDKSIKVWDAQNLRLLKVIDKGRHAGHGTSVNKLLWTSFNNQLLSASDDRTISAWDLLFL
jgi:WD40 repeat protein